MLLHQSWKIVFLTLGLWLPFLEGEPIPSSDPAQVIIVLDRSHPLHTHREIAAFEVEVGGQRKTWQAPGTLSIGRSHSRLGCMTLGRSDEYLVTVREILPADAGTGALTRSAFLELDRGLNVLWVSYDMTSGGRIPVAKPTLRLEKCVGIEDPARFVRAIETDRVTSHVGIALEAQIRLEVRKVVQMARERSGFPPLSLFVDDEKVATFPLRIALGNPHSPTTLRLPYRLFLPLGHHRLKVQDPAVVHGASINFTVKRDQASVLRIEYTRQTQDLHLRLSYN